MASSRICVTVTGASTNDLCRRRNEAFRDGADLVEVRLDTVRDPDAAAVLADRPGPVIVTCRPRWEGGAFSGSEDERRRLLRDAVKLGAEYVDVEWSAGFNDIVRASGGRGVILSTHDFEGVPADLRDRVRAMRGVGAEVLKIATMAKRLGDVVPLLSLASISSDAPLVVIAMGAPGIVTRICAARLRIDMDLCWRRRRTRTNFVGSLAARVSVPLHRTKRRALRDRRATYRPLSVAGDAQRRVRSDRP